MSDQQKEFVRAVQGWLGVDADGLPGPKTWEAWKKRTAAAPLPATAHLKGRLIDPVAFAAFAPKALPGTYDALENAAQQYGFKGLILAHWLGQMHVESGGFSVMEESLNYTVDALISLFGRHRISEAEARAWGRVDRVENGRKVVVRRADQQKIANRLYGGEWGRKNLGNPISNPNAGWENRGSGFKQLTGAANIKESGFTAQELRTDVRKSALGSAGFFVSHGCAPPALQDDVEGVTRKVNGGVNGLAERKAQTALAKKVVHSGAWA